MLYVPRILRKPEDTLADAKSALGKAVAKYDAASTHALTVSGKHMEEVQALSEVITTKQNRVKELQQMSGEARRVRDAISGVTV
jgi:hypothetical protein